MLRKKWLALAAAALCGLTNSARAQDHHPPLLTAPIVQIVDNEQQPEHVRSGIMGGASIYFLRPYINNNTAFTTTTGIGTATPAQSSEDFDWNYHVAPAVWLGWTSKCGAGFRARYFYFDQDSEGITDSLAAGAATTVITPPAGLSPLVGTPPRGFQSPGVLLQGGTGADSLAVGSDLHIETIDGEATFAHEWCNFGALLSVGGRYLQMRQNYLATLVNVPAAGASEISSLSSGHNFYGGGPTMGCLARFQFGRSGMAVFGSARGSFLIGNSRLNATFTETIVDPATGNQANVANSNSDDNVVVPIGELEGGLEYSRALGRTRLFFRGAAVNHTYFDAGSATGRDGNLSLFGAQVSLGLNY